MLLFVALIGSLYCMVAGIAWLADWKDPFAEADPSDITQAAATHGGRGGLVILAIRFWPYVLLGFGAFCAYTSFLLLRRARR